MLTHNRFSNQLQVVCRDAVLDELTSADRETDRYIVERARDALQILKGHHQVESIRQQYRISLTILAPEVVRERDRTGMSRRVAERLQINRNRDPFHILSEKTFRDRCSVGKAVQD